jgi:hypothetical protein
MIYEQWMSYIYDRACADRMAQNEAIVRSLLERWVSGLEPSVAMRDGQIIGLCDAAAEVGSTPWILEL